LLAADRAPRLARLRFGDFGILLSGCALSAACVSMEPRPPNVPGVAWTRDVLAQGPTPRTLRTARATLEGRRNLLGPVALEGRGFRYRLDLVIAEPHARRALRCAQGDAGGYRCEGDGPLASFALGVQCRRGVAMIATGATWDVEAWFRDEVHVGFLVRERGRPIAAIDTDHQWVRPVWVDAALPHASRVAIDALGYVVNDLLEAEENGGMPFLCGDLASRRRYPR